MSKMTELKSIDFMNENTFIQNSVLQEISKCLSIAGQYGGKCFGEFVREVVVPRSCNPECAVIFESVDIWFKADSDKFVDEMGLERINHTLTSSCKVDHYNLIKDQTILAKINIFVSDTCPATDFDVNRLTVLYKNNIPCEFNVESLDKFNPTVAELRLFITHKHARVLSPYEEILSDTKMNRGFLDNIDNFYFKRGWSVRYRNYAMSSRSSAGEFAELIKDSNRERITKRSPPKYPQSLYGAKILENSSQKMHAQDKVQILIQLENDIQQLRTKYLQILQI